MGVPPIGSVLLINFPFADLKTYKKRPALVVANSSLDTTIVCQITSKVLSNVPGVKIKESDFLEGGLPLVSYARPDKLFTVDNIISHKQLGKLRPSLTKKVRNEIARLFS